METKFAGRYIHVTTEPRNGAIYERARIRDGVSIIPVTAEGKIRFIRERPWHSNKVMTKLAAGFIEDNEEPLACAKRELTEELGLTASSWFRLVCAETRGAAHKDQHYFVAHGLCQTEACPEPEEEIFGYEDLSLGEVYAKALNEDFGTTASAFALLKLIQTWPAPLGPRVQYMHLNDDACRRTQAREKKIEARLNDPKRQVVRVGDIIQFLSEASHEPNVRVSVKSLLIVPTFEDLLDVYSPGRFYFGRERNEVLSRLRNRYSRADEEKYGVCGIMMNPLN